MWRSLETAPRDGSHVVCWKPGWDRPYVLVWKKNYRIADVKRDHAKLGEYEKSLHDSGYGECLCDDKYSDSYFGDPDESDDYSLATEDGRATYWHPLEPLPPIPEREGI